MARYRTVKPELWTSDQFADCSTNARLLFVGMWNFCDDAGIHPARMKKLKMEVFPGDSFTEAEVRQWIDELIVTGLVIEYEVTEGSQVGRYLQVTGWHHQKIDKPSCKYPPPNSETIRGPFDDRSESSRRVVETERKKERDTLSGKPVATVEVADDLPDHFATFWDSFPARNGRRRHKADAKAKFKRLTPDEQASLLIATENYAEDVKAQGLSAMDAHRFLANDRWKEFLEAPEVPMKPKTWLEQFDEQEAPT